MTSTKTAVLKSEVKDDQEAATLNHIAPQQSLADAAIAYAEAGLAVLPLRPRRKEPYGSMVRRGVKDATSDLEQIEWWWRLKPTANVGIATGNGLAVIDVDPRHGGQVDPAWPDTLTARTAGGGWHLYYGVTERVRNSNSAIAPGIDVKSDGGYVVAPPSLRDDGQWSWDTVMPLTMVSASVFHAVAKARTRGKNRRARTGQERRSPFVPAEVIPEGQRHSELTRWAGWLRGQGYSTQEIEEVLSAVNVSACVSPVPEKELAEIAQWAGRLQT